jgi:hypothetical protein
MTKDTFYFSHDHNSRTDPKIKRLLAKHGMQGYGIFWAIVEDLYNNANALQTDYETIAFDLRVDASVVQSIIEDFNLFSFDGETLWSASVERRLIERNKKSEKARQSALSRWNKKPDDANAMRTHSEGNAIKERKGKEIKGDSIKKFTPPEKDDVVLYFKENGYSKDAALKAFQYYDTAGWKDSKGNKVRNWKQKMIAVWFKDENKVQAKEYNGDNIPRLDIGIKGKSI